MTLLDAVRNATHRVEADLRDSNLFEHRGDRGEFRERLLERFLRPFLPLNYGLGSGAVFAADGTQSKQVDIVIYDAIFSNVLFRDNSNSLFPCESVFGSLEVKSDLDSSQLALAVANIASVKALRRAPSDMCDVLPFRRLGIGNGLQYDRSVRNPYLGLVFGYDGLVADAVVENLNRRIAESSDGNADLPDFVFNYKRGYAVMRFRREGSRLVPAPPGSSFDEFASVQSGADTLALFFLTTNICLNEIILKAPNLNEYWKQVVTDAVSAR